jgi:hypothetical protein
MNWNLTITLQDVGVYAFIFAMLYLSLRQINNFAFVFAMIMGFGALAALIGLPFLLLP